MASISSFSALHSIHRPSHPTLISRPSLSLHNPSLRFTDSLRRLTVEADGPRRLKQVTAVGEDTLTPAEEEEEVESSSPSLSESPAVTIPVSPSDILTMFFQAEGTLNELAIPSVAAALEETEGISDLKVQVVEGIASVELTKQTTIQSTGVASSLIETIQSAGFKLQTLYLSFEDKEDSLVNV